MKTPTRRLTTTLPGLDSPVATFLQVSTSRKRTVSPNREAQPNSNSMRPGSRNSHLVPGSALARVLGTALFSRRAFPRDDRVQVEVLPRALDECVEPALLREAEVQQLGAAVVGLQSDSDARALSKETAALDCTER